MLRSLRGSPLGIVNVDLSVFWDFDSFLLVNINGIKVSVYGMMYQELSQSRKTQLPFLHIILILFFFFFMKAMFNEWNFHQRHPATCCLWPTVRRARWSSSRGTSSPRSSACTADWRYTYFWHYTCFWHWQLSVMTTLCHHWKFYVNVSLFKYMHVLTAEIQTTIRLRTHLPFLLLIKQTTVLSFWHQ